MKVYHLSPIRNRDYIKKIGLIPTSKICGLYPHGPRICVSLDLKALAFDKVGRRNVDLWSVDVDENMVKQDENFNEDYYIEQNIKKESIKLKKTF